MSYIEEISDANALIEAFRRTGRLSDWKESVQRYEMNLLVNTLELQTAIRNGTYEQKPFFEFELSERGRTRPIRSMHISDRVVQRTVCDNALLPSLSKYLIYDNGASMRHKGITFARKRLETHLHRYYRKTGSNEGYILLWDFEKFFDNIPHDKLLNAIAEKVGDPELMCFVAQLIKSFEIDVSYMSDEEYANCMSTVYDTLDYRKEHKEQASGTKYMRKSVGIGSQISQVCGVFYPTRLDQYCKVVRGIKYYGRYMDDIYVIDQSKEYLEDLLQDMLRIAGELGLHVNMKKTQIVKLSHGFTFLQVRYNLTETGRVLKRLSPKRITRERRKLKKYRRLLDAGKMPFSDIDQAYRSWRGSVEEFSSYRSLKNMDKLFNELFIEPFKTHQ